MRDALSAAAAGQLPGGDTEAAGAGFHGTDRSTSEAIAGETRRHRRDPPDQIGFFALGPK